MEDNNKEEFKIDLIHLIQKLWIKKIFLAKVTLIGAVLGLIVAFSIPKEYTTTVIFTANSNQASFKGMGSLASLAGVNLNQLDKSDVFTSELYPNVIGSTPFVRGLLDIYVKDSSRSIDTTLYAYLKDEQKSAWWSYILRAPRAFMGLFKSKEEGLNNQEVNKYAISSEEQGVIGSLKGLYTIETDKKTGVTTFAVTCQSKAISAFLADTITSYLQSYIIQERTKKAKMDLDNTEKLYKQAQIEYDKAQQKFASFLDANKNIASARYAINQKKLENETNLAYSVYTQMAQQIQINKIKVQDDTPVFTIIEPAVEPLYPAAPKKKIILAAFVLLSFAIATGWVIRKDLWDFLTSKA